MSKVLLVEPSRLYRSMMAEVFKECHMEIKTVSTGQEALSAVKSEELSLICSAFELADFNGIELVRKIRDELNDQVPILLMTTEEDKDILRRALEAGVTEVFLRSRLNEMQIYVADHFREASDEIIQDGRILYVEDNKAVAAAVKAMLEAQGYEVEHYITGEEALEALESHDFDLVLTDMILAGNVTGLSLVRKIRKFKDKKSRLPILALSVLDDISRKVEVLRHGANDFVTKPVLEEELAARVTNLIANKRLLDRVEHQQDKLRELAMTDALTQLYNRHYLSDYAEKKISEARRHGYPLSLIIIDVDHFKAVNDNHGHAVGDLVLRAVAEVLKENCRNEDIAVRFGGEEFVILLTHCASHDGASKAEQLREAIQTLNPEGLPITASFGVAGLPEDDVTYDFARLFSLADKAVYQAKEEGRNRVIKAPGVLDDIEDA